MSPVRLYLSFPKELVEQPIIYDAANRFGVMPNILRASIEAHSGWVILDVSGEQQALDDAIAWFRQKGVSVNVMEGDALRS
jgi:ABC-type methionine transport system ATPase subunit